MNTSRNAIKREGHRAPGRVPRLLDQVDHAARQADHNAGKNQQRHSVAYAALGNLLAQPHDERAARGQGQHGHQPELPARIERETALFQADRDAERLHRAQNHRDVARPLRNLLAPQFAFFLQLGQRLIDHRQQLQNDRCRNVGHDAQGKNRHAAQLAARKQIDKSQQRSAGPA